MSLAAIRDWIWHGGALEKARAAYPDVERPWLDLSTGINPNPWPHSESVKVDWHRLPEEEELRALEEVAARHYGVTPSQICAVAGSEMAMRLTGLFFGGIGQCERGGYRTHSEMFPQSRLLDDWKAADVRWPMVFANPANPSGRILQPDELTEWLHQRGAAWTLIDEAYADAHPEISLAPAILRHLRLMIFKSIGKFFGLAGLRLGFVIAPPPWVEMFRQLIGAWPLSAAAIAIGKAALSDRPWIAATRKRLAQQAAQLDEIIQGQGLRSSGACHLFRRIHVADAHGLFHHLCQHGILTRPFADDPHHLRLGLPADDEQLARLAAALRNV